MRWIETRHLEDWAERTDARTRLSELLARLIRSSVSSATAIRFPSGDDAQIPGFDGTLTAYPAQGFERFVPPGDSVWEFGVEPDYLKKANSDFETRTHPENRSKGRGKGKKTKATPQPPPTPLTANLGKKTFVFVTPRRWDRSNPTLHEWVGAKKAESIWADVKVIDGVGLQDWLEQAPAVAARVAREIVGNFPSQGAYSTDEFWTEYSGQFNPSLTESVVVSGRAKQATQILQALSAGEMLQRWKGDFLDEPVAFTVAAIRKADPQLRRHLEARTLIVETKDAARQLSGQPNLIFITRESASELAGALSEKNTVIVPIGRESRLITDATTLDRPTTDQMAEALEEMFTAPGHARRLARESGRSLAVLARRIPSANAKTPAWANDLELIPALLAGAWDSASEHDRTVLARLAGTLDYTTFESKIREHLGKDDAPLERKGSVWASRAPVDLFVNLAIHLGSEHRDLLGKVAAEVFKEIDPTLALPAEERHLAPVRGAVPQFSTWLKDGIATTLLIVAALGEAAELAFGEGSPQQFANRVISGIPGLRDDPRVMASLSDQLPLLMEAAPDPLLSALEQMLEGNGEKAKSFFQDPNTYSFLGASSPHTGVLWALEVAAWDPKLLGRSASILAGLAEVDPGGQLSNRPINSLRQILLPWHPETNAGMRQRIAVVDHILSAHPSVGWKLLVLLLPRGHDVGGQSPKPKYKEADASAQERLTRGVLIETYRELIPRALARADSADKWAEILAISHAFPQEMQSETISALEKWSSGISEAEKQAAWNVVHDVVQHHSAFSDAEWSMSAELRGRLAAIASTLMPADSVLTAKWLFKEKLPEIEGIRAHNSWERVESARRDSIANIFVTSGLDGVLRLAETVEAPRYVGNSFGEVAPEPRLALEAVKRALAGPHHLLPFAEWASAAALRRFGDEWKRALRAAFESEGWSTEQLISVVVAWPHVPSTWNYVESFSDEAKTKYWRSRPAWGLDASGPDLEYAIARYLEADRPEYVIDWLSSRVAEIPSGTLLLVLDSFHGRLSRETSLLNSPIMWDIQQFLNELNRRDDVSLVERARREYAYLPALRTGLYESSTPALNEVMAEDPEFFVQVICDVYRPSGIGAAEPPPATEAERNRASWGWHLLESFRKIPGQEGNSVDATQLNSWANEVRKLAAEKDRLKIAEHKLGDLLANSPNDPQDRMWPARPVRDLLEEWKSSEIERGIIIGKMNMRGVTSRGMFDGGAQERELAASFLATASSLAQWPRTQSIHLKLAEIYEEEAKREDIVAEQTRLRER